jgi:hypothetical protein
MEVHNLPHGLKNRNALKIYTCKKYGIWYESITKKSDKYPHIENEFLYIILAFKII